MTDLKSEPARTANPWLAVALLFALLFWAGAFVAIRFGVGHYSPSALALLRFASGSIAIGVAAPFAGAKWPTRRAWPMLVIAAVAGVPVYHICLNTAETRIDAGTAALLLNTSPVMAALLAAAALRERPGIQGWFGTLVSFAGAAVIATRNGFHLDPYALWALAAAGGGAVYTVIQKPILRLISPMTFTSFAIWIGTICLLPFAPKLASEIRVAPLSATLAGVYMGIFPTAISYLMWAKVISRMNVSRAVSFLYLVPVFAVLLAWMLLGERPAVVAVLGGAMVIAGVVLVNTAKRREKI